MPAKRAGSRKTRAGSNVERRRRLSERELENMVEEATVDAYDESEQAVGFFTIIEDNLALPFDTVVLGVDVTVEKLDLANRGEIVAVCRRGRERQTVPLLDLPFLSPRPPGGSGSRPTGGGRVDRADERRSPSLPVSLCREASRRSTLPLDKCYRGR